MRILSSIFIVSQLLLACITAAHSETFRNAYISFELPSGWTCALEETEWVCSDVTESKQRTAIIILTAKERGDTDRFDLYEDHLSTSRPLMDSNGLPTGRSSSVEFVKRETIGDRVWIHGRQFESEVPSFYTDYFATVDGRIAILVTFSAHRQFFQRAFDRFFPSMVTIRSEYR
ncbi:hypothetical protein GA0061099_1004156 [Bradyrhizobium yuanmingense]|uniref:DUF1795 domain-containing protein n=1 Tax=Bradyrhizobium yuanmingense TaxID=108015 RepID=A0A1C3VKZ7_9BRAD|nr:hypothetical protein [Bradyrhizobium yuanmingense]TWI28570.1 hypothetical protein IQ15_01915 [Bradyrhizobium yuanmingense]SCB28442.1 hypothetical protein GA0061099_1004156 [Bradyrhizobium yuanmingense]